MKLINKIMNIFSFTIVSKQKLKELEQENLDLKNKLKVASFFLFVPINSTFHHINQSNNHSLKILIMILI